LEEKVLGRYHLHLREGDYTMNRIYRIFSLVAIVLLFAASASAQLPGEFVVGTKLVGVWEGIGGYRRPFSLEIVSIQGDKVKANYCWRVPTSQRLDDSSRMIGSMDAGCRELTGVIKDYSITFRYRNRELYEVEMVMDMEKNKASYRVERKTYFSSITTVKAGVKGAVE
jgi:hypothetical protein